MVAERWELEIAVAATIDRHSELGCSVAQAAEVVCEMHGISTAADLRRVRDVAELRLALAHGASEIAA